MTAALPGELEPKRKKAFYSRDQTNQIVDVNQEHCGFRPVTVTLVRLWNGHTFLFLMMMVAFPGLISYIHNVL